MTMASRLRIARASDIVAALDSLDYEAKGREHALNELAELRRLFEEGIDPAGLPPQDEGYRYALDLIGEVAREVETSWCPLTRQEVLDG